MESVWIAYISSTFFQLMWTLDCTENIGKILGYRMNYCPTVSLNNTDCTGKNNIIVNTKTQKSIWYENFKFTYECPEINIMYYCSIVPMYVLQDIFKF